MSDFDSTSSSSDDENFLDIFVHRNEIIRNKNFVEETVPTYSENTFKEHFRLSRPLVNRITEMFTNSDYCPKYLSGRENISAEKHILIFCWFAGHQTASFSDASDRFNVTRSTLYKVISRCTLFLSEMPREVITWPQGEEKYIIERGFSDRHGFPGVIGCLDGTHIKIDKPSEDPESYINRKGYYSIQVYYRITVR